MSDPVVLGQPQAVIPGQAISGYWRDIPAGYVSAGYGEQLTCAPADTLDLFNAFGPGRSIGFDRLATFLSAGSPGDADTEWFSFNQAGDLVVEQHLDLSTQVNTCRVFGPSPLPQVQFDSTFPGFDVACSVTLLDREPLAGHAARRLLVAYVAKTQVDGADVFTMHVARVRLSFDDGVTVEADEPTSLSQAYRFGNGFNPMNAPDLGGVPGAVLIDGYAYIPHLGLLVNVADCTSLSNCPVENSASIPFYPGATSFVTCGRHLLMHMPLLGMNRTLYKFELAAEAAGVVVIGAADVNQVDNEVLGSVALSDGTHFWFVGPNGVATLKADTTAVQYRIVAGRSPRYRSDLAFSYVVPAESGLLNAPSQVTARVMQALDPVHFCYPSQQTQGAVHVGELVQRYRQLIVKV